MPLLDHFRPPRDSKHEWRSFASNWVTRITDRLCELIPDDYVAWEFVKSPVPLSVDVEVEPNLEPSEWRSAWQPPPAGATTPTFFPEQCETHVLRERGGKQLVAVVALVVAEHKAEPRACDAFLAKVMSFLRLGVCVTAVDAVREGSVNLHNLIARRIGAPSGVALPEDVSTYAATYRPVTRDKNDQIDIWVTPFAVGDALPTMPLRLVADYFVPVELEATYTEACRRRRLIP